MDLEDLAEILADALSRAQAGDVQGAKEALVAASGEYADSTELWHVLGRIHLALGEAQSAVEAFEMAERLTPGLSEVRAGLAVAWLEAGAPLEALDSALCALGAESDLAENNLNEAVAVAVRVLESPLPASMRDGDLPELSADRRAFARGAAKLGRILVAGGHWEPAVRLLRLSAEAGNRDARLFADLGGALVKVGFLPRDPRAALANSLKQLLTGIEAIRAFLRAIELDPELTSAWRNLDLAIQILGASTALNRASGYCLERLLAVDPSDKDGRARYAEVLYGDHRFERAVAMLDSVSPGDPVYAEADLADLVANLEEVAENFSRMDDLMREGQADAALFDQLGAALARFGIANVALTCFDKAARSDPDNALYRTHLGDHLVSIRALEHAAAAYMGEVDKARPQALVRPA